MTALNQFDRLESTGLWRPAPGVQRRDVIVAVGKASLVLKDMNENALAHWSLAAVVRRNPGEMPALFAPDAEGGETLEIDEALMVEAIETVRLAILRRRPGRGRVQIVSLGAVAALVLGLGLLWLPGALERHAVAVAPPELRTKLGNALLARMTRLAGQPCTTPGAGRALARLAKRLDVARIVVLPDAGGLAAAHLPGGIILLNRALVEDYDDPAVPAGHVLAERARAGLSDPLGRLLADAGPLATLRLLTSGALPGAALDHHAETLMTKPPAPVPPAALLAEMGAAEISSRPYAYALDITGESVLALIEGDPMRGRLPRRVLPDGDWLRLQAVCGN